VNGGSFCSSNLPIGVQFLKIKERIVDIPPRIVVVPAN